MKSKRLIIVEGLPGSGKSTTAKLISDMLFKQGKKVVCIDEGDENHPADYSDYDFADFETERRMILKKWNKFVKSADEETIYVFNCIFLQNPMCETMMRFGMSEEDSCNYICEIADIIKPMNPLILYLEQIDEESTVKKVLNERGEGWLNAVIDYHVNQGYGKMNDLTGFDGYISCLEERQRRELNILKRTKLDSMVLRENISDEEFL